MYNSFSGIMSFMRRDYTRDLDGVDVAVTGIPFDLAVSNRPGTRFGPESIRRATAQHAWGPIWPWRFDPFDTLNVIDYGDFYYDHGHAENIAAEITQHVASIIESGASTLVLGGDHFITYPILKAYAAKYGPIGLVQFDSHRDFEEDDDGRVDHGTPFTRAVADSAMDPSRSIQIGIRTYFPGEGGGDVEVMGADEVHAASAKVVAERIRNRIGDGPAYLSFDIDFLDPAFAPGTGTPVPGGFSTYQALAILRELKGIDFVGMDLVEVSPPYDHGEITANAGAQISIEMLCLKAWAQGARA